MRAGLRNRNAQRGLAMLALVALLVMGSLYWLTNGLGQPYNRTALKRAQNAKVLQNAKTALIGYAATQTATAGQNDPGSLPCPEAPANVGNPTQEGIAAGNCTLPAVGRLPWRTLGIDKPLDAASEPLWYVVSPGWAKPNSTTNTVINSNSPGQITVDGIEAVAVIIAPGERLNIPASANCVARNQTRSVPSPAIDYRDYLDCHNATPADFTFTSSDPVGPFNDQVLAVTTEEILPVIEAAVASRFERELAPLIRSAYSNDDGNNPNPAWNITWPVLPFAATFGNPATADYKGVTPATIPPPPSPLYRGLLPFVRTYKACSCTPAGNCECSPTACTAGPADCDPAFVVFQGPNPTMSGAGNIFGASCSRNPPNTQITCTFNIRQPMFGGPVNHPFTVSNIAVSQVGGSLKTFQPEAPMSGVIPSARVLKGFVNADASATITLTGRVDASTLSAPLIPLVGNLLCNIIGGLLGTLTCHSGSITIPNTILVDHPIVDASNMQYGWFVRNQWHQVSYYAVAQEIAPNGSAACNSPASGTSSDCLTVKYSHVDLGDDRVRGLVMIAGRRLNGQAARPNGNFDQWFEGVNGSDPNGVIYTVRDPALAINRTFNDRIAVIDRN